MTKVILLKNKTVPNDPYEQNFISNEFQPVFVPLIKHFHLPEEALQLFKDEKYLNKLKYIIITSQRTVECLNESIMPRLSSHQKEILKQKTIYTVGPATSAFLENSGFQHVKGGVKVGNGSLLADLILNSHENEDVDHFLFLVGEIRRDIIPKKLNGHGYKVNEVVTYSTKYLDDNIGTFVANFKSAGDIVEEHEQTWVVFFSPQGTEKIIEFLKDNSSYRLASIGPTTEQYLLDKGLTPHVVSEKPEPSSLLNAINGYMKSL
ncbi:unnamed protein product [Kluyveromyces dobzhanskii CBS 2104]|uniref:WGS project CCBQ000000000 data, contig 00099 n=1 Tax=Kluyveromyces dobzhanskii CBS 2104 TaxID=1427455 RepID=A0A0A8L4I1_9SACH|nr:unnamed protein product [Kluyveromyces dobzhanskii CBS 2104]